MCGIYITNIPFEKNEIVDKLKSIEFRGPDNLGYEKVNDLSFGHLRLSILDLDERSNQPYSFDHLKIVFNGEIYNFEDIKKELEALGYTFETTSDTEVLIKGYSEWGKEILPKLNGMFAFAIYDATNNTVFCARDRMGVKPFFYYWKDGDFEICSQLRPIVNAESKIAKEAVSIYLDCGYIPSPYSIIENVYKLPPGNYMEIDLAKKTKNISEFWNLKPVEIRDISYEEAKKELHELLIDAVKIRLQSDVPLGSFLSGGIDSALVSAIASKISKNPINTFTIGFEDPKFDESKVAAQFAEIIGSNHTETICGPNDALQMLSKFVKVYDEPFADSSALPSLLLNSVTKQYVTVALSGDGGDESFIGYWHLLLVEKFKKISFIPYPIRKLLNKFSWYKVLNTRPETIKGILGAKDENELIVRIFTSFDSLQKKQDLSWMKYYKIFKRLAKEPLQRAADLNIKLWLENDSNVKVDRASMASSVEVRSPFLDYRIIEFARTLPLKYRYNNGVTKKIVRDILSEYIPEKVFNQPKKGFAIPLGDWIRNELKKEIVENLNDEFLFSVPNLDIQKFKKQMSLHMENKYDYSFSIWKLFVLSKWYKEFNLKLS
ncbi:asparagine synthase (glutamine-hydrolysing) [Flavobacterium endophyticum]|uniref:asparagine synthase (glutamine-hydrolyzing) n=1 Tax=Flavobacterium endophyticum TaxID=1540163 RepID=A0A495MC58_9FLAO|nr:asparagine synthase (glutamine-hydrolyzing) [Flavobacterium endophyticum]RKS21839.1 asparagine synthase (glutamine-hydrolysing) [Flavobacterium endophyticum]